MSRRAITGSGRGREHTCSVAAVAPAGYNSALSRLKGIRRGTTERGSEKASKDGRQGRQQDLRPAAGRQEGRRCAQAGGEVRAGEEGCGEEGDAREEGRGEEAGREEAGREEAGAREKGGREEARRGEEGREEGGAGEEGRAEEGDPGEEGRAGEEGDPGEEGRTGEGRRGEEARRAEGGAEEGAGQGPGEGPGREAGQGAAPDRQGRLARRAPGAGRDHARPDQRRAVASAPGGQGRRGPRRRAGGAGAEGQGQGRAVQDRRERPPDRPAGLQAQRRRGVHESAHAGVLPPAAAAVACRPGRGIQAD